MKEITTFKEAVTIFERYYNDWIKSEDYQLKKLFEQGWGGVYRDDGKLANGAIVAIMAVLKDPSVSRQLHALDHPINTEKEYATPPFTTEELSKIKKVVQQKMRTLWQGLKYNKVASQLSDFQYPHSSFPHLPDWVHEFYRSCLALLCDLGYLFARS